MANEENLKPFKPGESGNPNGRPPEACKALKKYTKKAISETFVELLEATIPELREIKANKQEKSIRAAIASVILKCWRKGESRDIDAILDRIIGKVPQKAEIAGSDGEPFGPTPAPIIQFVPLLTEQNEEKPPQEPTEVK